VIRRLEARQASSGYADRPAHMRHANGDHGLDGAAALGNHPVTSWGRSCAAART